jgi:hypothetical protein
MFSWLAEQEYFSNTWTEIVSLTFHFQCSSGPYMDFYF